MSDLLNEKKAVLRRLLQEAGKVAIAFSGGVDSTYLLYEAKEVLGENVIAVTAHSPSVPDSELSAAGDFCERLGIEHIVCTTNEMEIEEYRTNSPRRCYYCKHELFDEIKKVAAGHGISCVCDGSNKDDEGDYRPGLEALSELGIRSPLREAGMTKEDIRSLSKEAGLPTWNKPAFACLASRIPYGEDITPEKLNMAGMAEEYLKESGFKQVRVRVHGNIARIEILGNDFDKMLEEGRRKEVHTKLKDIGFLYVTLDLLGYRQGSMNEAIGVDQT